MGGHPGSVTHPVMVSSLPYMAAHSIVKQTCWKVDPLTKGYQRILIGTLKTNQSTFCLCHSVYSGVLGEGTHEFLEIEIASKEIQINPWIVKYYS